MYSPYTTFDAEQDMMPKRPSIKLIKGRKNPCQYTPLEVLRYRVKSGTFVAIVAQPLDCDIMDARIIQFRSEPETRYS